MDKKCARCKEIKSIDLFGSDRGKPDGKNVYCRICARQFEKEYNEKHPEKMREKYERRKQYYLDKCKTYRKQNPEIRKAHSAVNDAVRYGKIPAAKSLLCMNCRENQADIYHHYNGYKIENRLDVIPVCASCHKIIHLKDKEG